MAKFKEIITRKGKTKTKKLKVTIQREIIKKGTTKTKKSALV